MPGEGARSAARFLSLGSVLVTQMDDVPPSLAQIPSSGFVEVNGAPEYSGLAGGQLGEDLTSWGDDRGGAVLAGVGGVGGEDEPLVFCCTADQVAPPYPGRLGRVSSVGEVDEGLRSCVGEVLPLLGEADLAAELDADGDGTAVQVE